MASASSKHAKRTNISPNTNNDLRTECHKSGGDLVKNPQFNPKFGQCENWGQVW